MHFEPHDEVDADDDELHQHGHDGVDHHGAGQQVEVAVGAEDGAGGVDDADEDEGGGEQDGKQEPLLPCVGPGELRARVEADEHQSGEGGAVEPDAGF